MRINTYSLCQKVKFKSHFAVLRYINTPAISVTVVMKGEDIRAGSSLILSNNKGRIAPAVAAKVVIDIKLITSGWVKFFNPTYKPYCSFLD